MSEVMFYHLERQTLEDVLPVLLEKTLERGWRAVVEVPDPDIMDALDRHLWTYRDVSFLPHASERDDAGARQPIWLTTGQDTPNGASVRFLAHRAEPTNVDAYERVVLLFSAHEPEAVTHARSLWKPLQGAGHACTYWQQTQAGAWEKQG
ncbi:MAG: DNA polymerase III subunit chi [Pseudomonadota bacterium]